jgi:hypothetical protein
MCAFAELRRFDKPIGITVDLAKAHMVELAWRNKAPKKLVATNDAEAGGQ